MQSKKIFAFGSLHASNADSCGSNCIGWGWHVAPLVLEQMPDGKTVPMVLDPSLFSAPATVEAWKAAQMNCGSKARVDTVYVLDSKIYSWNYKRVGLHRERYFYEDPGNHFTLDFLVPECKTCPKRGRNR